MNRTSDAHHSDPAEDPRNKFWYSVLTMFPFVFIPLVILIAILSSWIMPYLTGVRG